ncbi:MAG: hypothetical protein HC825_06670 [Oscillatoriales cyanobacterium RM1_1_9]|nr:hypothetical protein [Oscillatoriales cyanobacterium SM2_3_0]NJO45266.1 hypothetical protein [Oscillatoriales cyanobacterium RM2_1_1]NJO71447.1 hypothetical protein [Oscillatoriales cyanobacterium RM1_1_9]
MIEQRLISLKICYLNGESQSFEFPAPQEEKAMLASYIQRILTAEELMLEVDNCLVVIPMQNIQRLEISPPPLKLPDTVIQGVHQIS